MIEPSDLLLGGLLPAVAAAVVLAFVWKFTRHAGAAWSASLTVGYLAGHWALDANTAGFLSAVAKSFNPHEARDWLPLAILLSSIPCAVALAGKKGRVIAWLLRAVLCVFLPWRLLVGSAYLPSVSLSKVAFDTGAWSTPESVAWLSGISTALFTAWLFAEAENRGSVCRLRASLATLVALSGAVVLAMSGSFTYGQLLGVLTATLAGSSLIAIILRLDRGPESAAGPLVAVFGGALVLGHFFSELRLLNACLLLLAMAVAIGWMPPKLSQRMQVSLRCLLCLIPLTIAVTLAAMEFSATQVELESNPYLNFRQ